MTHQTLVLIILTIILIGHLYEEFSTDLRTKFPLGEMPLWLFIMVNIILYICIAILLYLSITSHPWARPLAIIYSMIMLGNSIGHISIMIFRRSYFPGGISAIPMLPVAFYLFWILL